LTDLTKGQLEAQPFTGIAFTEGTGWRAEVTYQDGILDGPVTVVVNQKVFSQFRYDKGLKVLEKKSQVCGEPPGVGYGYGVKGPASPQSFPGLRKPAWVGD